MTDIYVSRDGDDSNDGTIDSPIQTWDEARNRVGPGVTIYMRGGTYPDEFLLYNDDGEPGNPIRVEAYQDEEVIFEESGSTGRCRGHHIRLKGLTFANSEGVVFAKPDTYDVKVVDCEAYNHVGDGFRVSKAANDIEFHNCTSHHNYDTPISSEEGNRNADGFNVTGRAYNVRFYDCDAYHNVDDGFDTNRGGFGIELWDCRAWNNGRNPNDEPVGNGVGIKMQNGRNYVPADPGKPTLNIRCSTWENVSDGQRFYRTGGECYAINLTSFDNGDDNFQSQDYYKDNYYEYSNCISAGNGDVNIYAGNQREFNNSWNLDITDPRIKSFDPDHEQFLELSADSPCIDAGTANTEVRLPYSGEAPDLGCKEKGDVFLHENVLDITESSSKISSYVLLIEKTAKGAEPRTAAGFWDATPSETSVTVLSDVITVVGEVKSGRDRIEYDGDLSEIILTGEATATLNDETIDTETIGDDYDKGFSDGWNESLETVAEELLYPLKR